MDLPDPPSPSMQTRKHRSDVDSAGPGSRASTLAAESPPRLIRQSCRTGSVGADAVDPVFAERGHPQCMAGRGQITVALVEERWRVPEWDPVELGRCVRIRIDLDQGGSGGGDDPEVPIEESDRIRLVLDLEPATDP